MTTNTIVTTNASIVAKLEQSLVAGSLGALVAQETANVFLLIDCSSSMRERMQNGRSRIAGLRSVVEQIERERPTPLVAFGPFSYGDTPAQFVTTVPDASGGTPLAETIDFAKANGATRVVVISDGEPNNPEGAMEAAARFGGRIDVVFVGDAGPYSGAEFLDRLAQSTGGERFVGDLGETKAITGKVMLLLNA